MLMTTVLVSSQAGAIKGGFTLSKFLDQSIQVIWAENNFRAYTGQDNLQKHFSSDILHFWPVKCNEVCFPQVHNIPL